MTAASKYKLPPLPKKPGAKKKRRPGAAAPTAPVVAAAVSATPAPSPQAQRAKVEANFRGPAADFLADETREIDLEGALSSGKTTVCLFKLRRILADYPGIKAFAFRYSNTDTESKLRPAFEEMCTLFDPDDLPKWDSKEWCYDFRNGSKCYAFGLKAADQLSRYSKMRGLGVSVIYNDQSEELPADIGLELRARIRKSITDPDDGSFARFPKQLIFSPNPPPVTHWLVKQFPEKNIQPGRKLYQVSIYDNAHNLPPETIVSMEAAYPPDHAKHKSVILGQRGLNVMGDPVYAGAFVRKLHVRTLVYDADAMLYEAFDFYKHHPCWVVMQQPYTGGMWFLGGILGQNMFLEDFLPIVRRYRAEWFPALDRTNVRTCCTATLAQSQVETPRFTGVTLLRAAKFTPVTRPDGNSPDTVLALIETIAGFMRRRAVSGHEALGVSNDNTRWLRASREGIEPCPFVAEGFEAGYVWSPNVISVGRNEVRQPLSDDWFEHGMRCAENLELNFGAEQPTQADRDRQRQRTHNREQNSGSQATGATSWLAS